MASKLRLILDTHRTNFKMQQWPITVLDPLDVYGDLVDQALAERATIDKDPHLTAEGKMVARAAKRDALLKAISDVRTPRTVGYDADIASHRTALIPASTERPDTRRIDFLLSHLRDRTPLEIATFYNSATPDEQLALEHAAASVGRIPTKNRDGSLKWTPLLAPETINENIIARATAKNPQGAMKLRELEEIKATHESVANIAAAEIKDAFGS